MFSKLYKYGIFLSIPGLVLGFSLLLKLAGGPYWLAPAPDGPYVYIINGLDIAKGNVPNDITHPAVPTMILCCAVERLFNIGRPVGDLVTNVLTAPEFYLQMVFVFLSLFSFLTSFALAVYVFRKTGDKIAALLTQLPALSFLILKTYPTLYPVIPIVANVGSENSLVGVINLFNLCLLMNFFATTSKERLVSSLFWGFVCGLGCAEKLTVIPLLMVPLIILSWRDKAVFVGAFAASFVLWTLPILSKYAPLWAMIKSYVMIVGTHGPGQSSWKVIIIDHWEFVGIVFAALLLALWKFAVRRSEKVTFFLLVVSLGVLVNLSVVARHLQPQYVMPSLGLFSSLLVLFYLQGPGRSVWGRKVTVVLILAFTFAGIWRAMDYRSKMARFIKDVISFDEHVKEKYRGCSIAGYYRSSGQAWALHWGDGWKGDPEFRNEMYKLYPNSYFLTGDRIISFKDRVLSNDLLDQSSCLLFRGDETYGKLDLTGTPLTVQLLEKGNFESIYQVTGTTEKQAMLFFAGAAHFYEAGDFKKALIFALQAKALHYQPQSDVDTFIQFVTPYAQRKG